MRGSEQAQGKQQHDDIGNEDAGGREDHGCNHDAGIGWSSGPYDAKHECCVTRHAEAEHRPGHEELVAAFAIDLEDCHVAYGAKDVEGEEDGADGDVETDCGEAADDGFAFWDVGWLQERCQEVFHRMSRRELTPEWESWAWDMADINCRY